MKTFVFAKRSWMMAAGAVLFFGWIESGFGNDYVPPWTDPQWSGYNAYVQSGLIKLWHDDQARQAAAAAAETQAQREAAATQERQRTAAAAQREEQRLQAAEEGRSTQAKGLMDKALQSSGSFFDEGSGLPGSPLLAQNKADAGGFFEESSPPSSGETNGGQGLLEADLSGGGAPAGAKPDAQGLIMEQSDPNSDLGSGAFLSSDLQNGSQTSDPNGGAPPTAADKKEGAQINVEADLDQDRRDAAANAVEVDAITISKEFQDLKKLGAPEALKFPYPTLVTVEEMREVVNASKAQKDAELLRIKSLDRPPSSRATPPAPLIKPSSVLNLDRP